MKKLFCVNVNKYKKDADFEVYYPASLDKVKDHAVTFLTKKNIKYALVFEKCSENLIFWPEECEIIKEIKNKGHVFIKCEDPHLRFCEFFEENEIVNTPKKEEYRLIEGAWICEGANIGKNVIIQPGAYISGETTIGDDSYIGCGVKIIGKVRIGEKTVIRENTIIGADGLTTDRNKEGKPVKMPQFGGVNIGDRVSIGASVVIARGAIDDTVIGNDTAIDNCSFISHNVVIGDRVFIVGESILFGSVKVKDNVMISGNATIRNGVSIGEGAFVGMGAVVVKDVQSDVVVKGNPAK